MNSNQKGELGEIATIKRLKELNFGVYTPFGENTRSDIIMEEQDGTTHKIQVKTARQKDNERYIKANLESNYRSGDSYRRRAYKPNEIDAFVIYYPKNNKCYWVDIEDAPNKAIKLRFESKQDQKSIRWAEDYELKNVLQ